MKDIRKCAVAAVTLVVLFATGAAGATSLSYRGKTSQKRRISFSVSGGSVRSFGFHIVDKCSAERILLVTDHGFPTMTISHSKFGGTFHNKQGSKVTVSGHTHGQTVSGSLTDSTRNDQTHRLCSGSATFSLHPQ